MYTKDFNRLLKLSDSGVSDIVIVLSIIELCADDTTAALYVVKFIQYKYPSTIPTGK